MSSHLEVQGIVSVATGEPLVQAASTTCWAISRASVTGACHCASTVPLPSTWRNMNATYDAALMAWAREQWPDDDAMGARLLMLVRDYRADAWGLPDQPEDWRP